MEKLYESLTSIADVSGIDTKVLEDVINGLNNPSLPASLLSTIDLNSPKAKLFGLGMSTDRSSLELKSNIIDASDGWKYQSGVTIEAIQDLYAQFGIKGLEMVSGLLRVNANIRENEEFQKFLDLNCVTAPITFDNSVKGMDLVFELSQFIYSLVQLSNSPLYRAGRAWVVLPYKLASIFAGAAVLGSHTNLTNIQNAYHVLDTPLIKIYSHFNTDITEGYVGVFNPETPHSESAFMGRYQNMIFPATNPDTGNQEVFVVNRFGFAANPLHSTTTPMLWKFDC